MTLPVCSAFISKGENGMVRIENEIGDVQRREYRVRKRTRLFFHSTSDVKQNLVSPCYIKEIHTSAAI